MDKPLAAIGVIAVIGIAYHLSKKHKRHHKIGYGPKLEWESPLGLSRYHPRWPYGDKVTPLHHDMYTGRLVSYHEPYPSQPMDVAEDWIIDMIVNEFVAHNRLDNTSAASLKERIYMDYMDDIHHIAKLNHFKKKPLYGAAQSKYSHLVVEIVRNHGLYLSPSAIAKHQAETFYIPSAVREPIMGRVHIANNN